MSSIEIQSQQIEGTGSLYFSRKVQQAYATVQGFRSEYDNPHQVRFIDVGAKVTELDENKVTVETWARINDGASHNSSGPVVVVVIAELADA